MVGCVRLGLGMPGNGQHRAEVSKLRGWRIMGTVEDYALRPDGVPAGTTFMAKRLR